LNFATFSKDSLLVRFELFKALKNVHCGLVVVTLCSLVTASDNISTPMMEEIHCSRKLVSTCKTTWHNNPEDHN
jgi:hypothetical protein